MNQKTMRKYELIARVANDSDNIMRDLAELCGIDFQTAFEMWEFALANGKDIVPQGIELFLKSSETKTRQLFAESLPLQKLVYSNKDATDPSALMFLANFILGNKLDVADECLQRLRTNTNMDFGDAMKLVLDTTFSQYCYKNNVRVPSFSKKQKELLVGFVDKIKGPNRALLLQRMKEI
jgi:hypothetical protein